MLKSIRSLIHKLGDWQAGFCDRSGFTMIELLVTTSIMILLTGGGVAAFITYNDKQQLQGSTKLIQSYLRAAQTKARVGDRPEGCDKLLGYQVSIPQGSNGINLEALCEINGEEVPIQTQSTTLAGIAAVDSSTGEDVEILFKVLHGGTDNEGVITVTSAAGATETFRVSAGGEISELGASESNPTGGNNVSPSPEASPSPTPSPSPSPLPSSGVILNASTGLSCTQICVQNNFVRCDSVGTNTTGTNGNARGVNTGVCVNTASNCTTTMPNRNKSCSALGTTAAAKWAYCKCSN